MERTACAFTGHRPKSFPWKYDEAAQGCVLLKEILAEQIAALADAGVTDWFSGMAQGVDLWAAELVLTLRKKNPALNLHCILPCEGQERKWPVQTQRRYRSILEQANDVVCVGREYTSDCMLKRNRYLVDHASVLLAIYDGGYRSGTGMTVRYAKDQGRELIIIKPISREVSHTAGSFSPDI